MNIIKTFKKSFDYLKNTKAIVICSFLLAISIVLGRFSVKIEGLTIVTASFIANAICGMFFGPVLSSILAGLTDVLNHILQPKGAYFFGWTLNSFLAGILYGLFLYRGSFNIQNKKQLLFRIILVKILISVFINLGLGTLWLSINIGKSYIALLIPRITKELILIPVHIILLFIILPFVDKIRTKINLQI